MNVMPTFPQLMQDQDIAFSLNVTGLDENKLLVTAFDADERLNGLTRVDVALTSTDADIDLTTIIDKPVTLSIFNKYDAEPRHFSGVVAAVSRGDSGHRRTAYQLTILPPLARLAHISDSRIFQAMSVPEIVKKLLEEHRIHDVRWNLDSRLHHNKREFCVMYQETLLAFIERICAEEGIWFYFIHEAGGKCIVVFIDNADITPWCEHQKELEYNAMASGAVKGVYCSHFSWREQLRSTSYVQKDYTFKNPPCALGHSHRADTLNGVQNVYPVYDGYGRYKDDDQGKSFTRYKLEATRVDASTGEGFANAPHLTAGHRFQLTEHPKKALNEKYLILSVRHSGRQPQALGKDAAALVAGADPFNSFAIAGGALSSSPGARLAGTGMTGAGSGARAAALGSLPGVAAHSLDAATPPLPSTASEGMAEATLYANSFTIMPALLPYRPPQLMKPLVDGPQIAHVVGPPGEEIYTDEHGRVKVQFTWDRYGEANDRSSCWIRVAQNWGGASWGHIAIPRIGHEVIVDFLQGDPDQPIVIGRTYHQNNHPPYKLPDHKTKMVIRSETHKGRGFNEISFEDQSGEENVHLHAQKDHTIKVLNNSTQRVDANKSISVGANNALEVGNNMSHQVGGGLNVVVGGVGGGVAGLIGSALSALMGQSAGMLGAAMKAVASAATNASGSGAAKSGQAAATSGSAGPDNGSEAGSQNAQQEVGGFGDTLGGGNLGSTEGDFDNIRNLVNGVAAHTLFTTGGKQIASGGEGIASQVAGMIGGGIMNTLVSKMQNNTVGLAQTEQIGIAKVLSVGQMSMEQVGSTKKVRVGDELLVEVGGKDGEEPKSSLLMKSDGTIVLKGVRVYVHGESHVQVISEMVDHN